jgi:hypothetical protein
MAGFDAVGSPWFYFFWIPATLDEMAEGFVYLVGLFLLFLDFTPCFGCGGFLTDVNFVVLLFLV